MRLCGGEHAPGHTSEREMARRFCAYHDMSFMSFVTTPGNRKSCAVYASTGNGRRVDGGHGSFITCGAKVVATKAPTNAPTKSPTRYPTPYPTPSPTNVLAHKTCKHTQCTWNVNGKRETEITTTGTEKFHCEKMLNYRDVNGPNKGKYTSCRCVCDKSLSCVLRHHHRNGYK